MKKWLLLVLVIAAIAGLSSPAYAQGSDARIRLIQTAALADLKTVLRNLATAEERHANQWYGLYTNEVAKLGIKIPVKIIVVVFRASDKGWAARATHANLPGKSCVIFTGTIAGKPPFTDADDQPAKEAEPTCDRI